MTQCCRFCVLMLFIVLSIFIGRADAQAAHRSATISAVIDMSAVHTGDKAEIAVIVTVNPGLHAQSHNPTGDGAVAFTLTLAPNPGITIGEVDYPPGQSITYPLLGTLNVYEGFTIVKVPVTITAGVGPLKISGKIRYQACNDHACFFPETQNFEVSTNVVASDVSTQANIAYTAAITPLAITQPTSQPAAVSPTILGFDLTKNAWPLAFSAAFLIGVIFNAMPCVLPVLPLKIMGFYEVSQHDRRKSVLLGSVFSIGLIASFGVLAVLVVGLRTLNWGGLFQHAWFTATISGVLIIMAISTFGFFTINVPSAMYQFTPRHDTYVGNFLFGVLTAALSTPCTFGMFVGLLAWAITQPAWEGVSLIMMVGVGMASPYFILSAFPAVARNFPRTGPWAEVVKQMMAFLLLATAIYFAQPFFQKILSDEVFWWTMFAVIAAGGLFLIVRTIQLSNTFLPRAISVGVAMVMVIPALVAARLLTAKPYDWIPYSDQALVTASASGHPVLIDFTATWCGNCHYLEAFVMNRSAVIHAVHDHDVVMLKGDVTNEDAAARPLLAKLTDVGTIPLTAIYFPHHDKPKLLDGIYSADDLVNALDSAKPE